MTFIKFNYENSNIIAQPLSKTKNSISTMNTYKVLPCQNITDKNYDTTNWISLDEIIKNNKDLRIFKALLTKTYNIIVKIAKSETIEKEYKTSMMLRNISGFIKYLCYFSCNNYMNKYNIKYFNI